MAQKCLSWTSRTELCPVVGHGDQSGIVVWWIQLVLQLSNVGLMECLLWKVCLMSCVSFSTLALTVRRDMPIRVLGFWWWWLFVVPSLRSRRPKGAEKKALDIAFLGTPLISLIAPAATKDTAVIWAGM